MKKDRLIRIRLSQQEVNALKFIQGKELEKGRRLNISEYIRNLIMKDVCLKSGPSTNNIEDIIGSRVVWNVPEEDRSYNGVITSYELYIEDKFPYSASLLFYLEPTGDIVDKYDLDQMRYGGVYLEDLIFSNKIVEKVVITNNNVKTY